MKRDREKNDGRDLLGLLRPDELTRARLRRTVMERAAPILARRRALAWHEVTAGWSSLLVPLAAALIFVFAGLAYRAARPDPDPVAEVAAATIEELIAPEGAGPPALLTRADEPDADYLLSAVMTEPEPDR